MNPEMNLDLISLENAAAHRIGNKHNEEGIIVSHEVLPLRAKGLTQLLQTYFTKPFKAPEFFRFRFSNGDHTLNPLFQFCSDIFADPDRLLINSVHIAKHLYELSHHPNIKPGDLFVAYFHNAVYNGVSGAAVGIFKSERKQKFLKVDEGRSGLVVEQEAGIAVDQLDKGCIIFDTEKDDGYRLLAVDRTNKGQEAVFWQNDFLGAEHCVDSFYRTREVMNEARLFVAEEASREMDLDRATQIDLMNKTAAYFREKETFEAADFEETVFKEPELIDAYRNFRQSGLDDPENMNEGSFDISAPAVKKYGRIYKSVLKLDKNFHIYIHGNREMIERGTDPDGRKYYKVYYEEEH